MSSEHNTKTHAAASMAVELLVEPSNLSDRQVSMSNRLARSAQGLNLAEKRLVAIGLANTDSIPLQGLHMASKNSGWKMRVTAMEYAEAFGVTPQTSYEQLKNASEKLFDRYVRYEVKGRKGEMEEKKFRWVSGVHYAPGEGYVELNFSPEIAPHLLGLRKQFTTYKLRHAAAFDSIYAWRLYELLRSWQDTGVYSPTIETFWDAVEAPPSCRKDFKSLRTRVIEPAVAAIQAKAGLIITWQPVRSGSRRVTGLEFKFELDRQGRLMLETEQQELDSDIDD